MPKVKGKLVKAKGPKIVAVKKPREIALPSKPPLAEYDPAQLRMGIEVEKEHTSDPKLARQIAEDHLREIPDYYTRLIAMENEYKKEVGERDKKKNWTYLILRRRQDEKKPTLRKTMNLSYAEGIVEIQQGKNQAGGYGWQCELVPATTKDGGIKYLCRKMGPEKLRIDYIFELLAMPDFEKIKAEIIFEGKHGQTTGEEVAMVDKRISKYPKESEVHELVSILIAKGYADASIVVELEKQFHLLPNRYRAWLKTQIGYVRKMMGEKTDKDLEKIARRWERGIDISKIWGKIVEGHKKLEKKLWRFKVDIGSTVDYHGKKAIVTNVFKDGVEIDIGDGNLEIVSLNELYGELTKNGKHFAADGVERAMIYEQEDIEKAFNFLGESIMSLRIAVDSLPNPPENTIREALAEALDAKKILGKYIRGSKTEDVSQRGMPYSDAIGDHAQALVNTGKKAKEILTIMMKELDYDGAYREEERAWGRDATIEAIKSAIEDAYRIFKRKEVNLGKKVDAIPEAVLDLVEAEIDRVENV
jgi:hypothetical protein